MTGSAFQRWTLWWRVFSVEKGGGLEEGGLEGQLEGRDENFPEVQNRVPMQVQLSFSQKHRKIRNQQ